MIQEQEKVKMDFLREATSPSNNFTDNQAMFMWNYIVMTIIIIDKTRHGEPLE